MNSRLKVNWEDRWRLERAVNEELVALLEKLSKQGIYYGDGTIDFETGDEINAAIIKAKGETIVKG